MAITTLNGSIKCETTWSAQIPKTGTDYGPLLNGSTLAKTLNFGTSVANGVSGGSDELVSYIVSIAAGGNTTLDLRSITDVMNQTGTVLARIKGWMFRLLSTDDDSTIGTACSSVTIGNAAANQQLLNLGAAAHTLTLNNGDCLCYLTPKSTGWVVDATHKDIKIVNNDGSVIAKVQVTFIGATS